MTGCLPPRLRRLSLALLLVLAPAPGMSARAQPGGADSKAEAPRDEPARKERQGDAPREAGKAEPTGPGAGAVAVEEPTAWRVYQRSGDDRGEIPIVLGDGAPADAIARVTLTGGNLPPGGVPYRDGKLVNVPTGGPYRVLVGLKARGNPADNSGRITIGPVFVGDLWVLAGQSNMEGVGNLIDVTPPSDRVMALGMDGRWGRAEEPLHWLVDSPDPVHSGNPDDRAARSEALHRTRTKGAGLGLPFGVVLSATTNVPVGLVACAHGGTSLGQWDPAKKDQGGKSLYGSMLRQVKLAGGKVRGVLWYQGESDAMNAEASARYGKAFADFIAAVRDDLGQPELPFYFVQIGRFVMARDPKGWNAVQEAQRLLPDRVPGTAVVASVDLELDDLIHVGTQGLKRLGIRLARIAQRELFGQAGATTPTLDRVSKRPDNTLAVKFKGVNRAPGGGPQGAGVPGMPGLFRLSGPSLASPSGPPLEGLQPMRHIAGFSIRKEDGTEIPLIYDAAVGPSRDTVLLKLTGKVPDGAHLWYGYGLDPDCNLTDALDMAVPVFGPIALDELK